MKRRKRLIILGTVLASLCVIVILSSTIFSLTTVGVEYRTTMNVISESQTEEIISSGNFSLGKSIFFLDFDKNIEEIEKAYPYIKVVNIERKFPNSAIINIAERVPAVKIKKSANSYLILDNELKVINIVDNGEYQTKTGEETVPEISVSSSFDFVIDTNFEAGQFMNNDQLKGYVDAFYKGAYAYNKVGVSVMEEIIIGYDLALNCVKFDISFRSSDTTATIYTDSDLEEVTTKVVATFATNGSQLSSIYSTTEGKVYGIKK